MVKKVDFINKKKSNYLISEWNIVESHIFISGNCILWTREPLCSFDYIVNNSREIFLDDFE